MKFLKLKTKKHKIIFFSAFGGIFVAICVLAIILSILTRVDYVLSDHLVYEVNTENTISTLFSQVNSGTIKDPEATLDTTEVGEKYQEIIIVNQLGVETVFYVTYNVVDTTAPTITGDEELSFATGEEVDLLSYFTAEDNSERAVKLSVEGDYDFKEPGNYTINIVAEDESGNRSAKDWF